MGEDQSLGADVLLAHAGWMRTLAGQLVRDAGHADDVAQDSWLAAARRPPGRAADPTAWLARVVTNTARQLARGESRRARRERAAARPEALPSTYELVEQAELQRDLASAILALEEPYRSTVLLRFYHDLAPQEISALQGIPGATVRGRLRRALELLRSKLDNRFEGEGRSWRAALLPLLGPSSPGSALASGDALAGLLAMGAATKLAVLAGVVAAVAVLGWLLRGTPMGPTAGPQLISLTLTTESAPTQGAPLLDEPAASQRLRVPARVLPVAGSDGAVEGSVRDSSGRPLSGVRIRVGARLPASLGDAAQQPEADALSREQTSDSLGRFRVDRIAPGWNRITAVRAGHAGWTTELEVHAGSATRVEIVMTQGSAVSGRVYDEGGGSVAGALVWVSPYGSELPGPSTRSEQDGAYRIEDLIPGWVQVNAQPGPERGELGMVGALVQVEAGEQFIWDAVLPTRKELRGRVVDGAGRALPGWWVFASPNPGDQGPLETDSEGAFSFGDCETRPFSLVARPTRSVWGGPPRVFENNCYPGREQFVLIAGPEPSAFIEGVVLNADGLPAGDVQARTTYRNAPVDPISGRFELGPLPAGTYPLYLKPGSPAATLALGRYELAVGERLDVGVIQLERPGRLVVTLLGMPEVDNLDVNAWVMDAMDNDGVEDSLVLRSGPERERLEVGGLQPGAYELSIQGEAIANSVLPFEIRTDGVTRQSVTLQHGASVFIRLIEPALEAPAQRVHITVSETLGRTVQRTSLTRNTRTWEWAHALRLAPGSYVVEAVTDAGLEGRVAFDVEGQILAHEAVTVWLR